MSDLALAPAAARLPFEGASELRRANADLIEALDRRLGQDSRPESEAAALVELEPRIREFLARGVATGEFIDDIKERTACQVLLDYWTSTLSHAGVAIARVRLRDFDAARLPDLKDKACPYKGFETIRDRALFFGRDAALEHLLERVAELPLVVVQGASGSGKSSLVIAGALPVLGAEEHEPRYCVVGPFTPNNAVLDRLVAALAAVLPGTRIDAAAEAAALRARPQRLAELLGAADMPPVLVVIDQFEEIFTLCDEPERRATVAALDALLRARPEHRAILSLREEFSPDLDLLEPLAGYLARHARFSMKEWPMGPAELRAAIEGPAATVKLHFAPGIVDDIVHGVLGRDTALPLLQFALQRLWVERDRNRITRDVYEKIGGAPLDALKTFADGFYKELKLPELQNEVERVLLELVRIDRMLEPYRQPRLRSELLAGGTPRTADVLRRLEEADFVRIAPTADGDDATVEVKHEALLRNWPLYIEWIDKKRDSARKRITLTDLARRWSTNPDKKEGLLTEWQLKELRALSDLSELEVAYRQASQEAVDSAREGQVKEARRQGVRKAASIAVVCAALAGLVVAGLWNRNNRRQELQARQVQDALLVMARANEASARGKLDHALNEALAGVTRIRAVGPHPAPDSALAEAHRTLLAVLRSSDDVRRLFVGERATFQAAAFLPGRDDATVAYAGSGGQVHVATLLAPAAGGVPLGRSLPTCGTALVTSLAFGPNGRWLAAGCADGNLSVWSTADWTPRGRVERVFEGHAIWTMAAHPGGRLLALGGYDNRVRLVALREDGTPESAEAVEAGGPGHPVGYVWSLAFAPSGEMLLVGDGVGAVLVCRGMQNSSWACRKSPAFPGEPQKDAWTTDAIRALAFAPNGAFVAIGRWNGRVDLTDANVTVKRNPPLDVDEIPGPVHSLAFQQACGRLQLAIGKGNGLLYRAVAASADEAEQAAVHCRTRASVGDEVYSVASHAPSGLIAAATRGGYLAVLAPPGSTEDPLRRSVHRPATPQKTPLRAAIVGAEGAVTRVVVRSEAATPGRTQLVLLTLVDGRASDVPSVVVADIEGRDVRLAGQAGRRLLAVLRPGPTPGVTVQPLDERFTSLKDPVLALGPAQFGGRTPARVALSPDGKWLVLAFKPAANSATSKPAAALLLASVDRSQPDRWIPTELKGTIEIAFSADSQRFGQHFAAGGEAPQGRPDSGAGQVQLWQVASDGLKPMNHPPMRLSPQANRVYELAFAADASGRPLLLAGGESGVIDRWEVESGRRIDSLRADSLPVHHIAYSPQTSLVAAADTLNVVRIWDTRAGEPVTLTRAQDRSDSPGFIAFGGDGGAWLLNGSRGAMQVWDLGLAKLRDKACALLRKPGQHGAETPRPPATDASCGTP